MSDDLPEQLGHLDDDRPVRDDLREHLGKEPMDEPVERNADAPRDPIGDAPQRHDARR